METERLPSFALESSDGGAIRSTDLLGTPYVLYFYPKDLTQGCTIEAQEFRDLMPDFQKLGVRVFGVSPDPIKAHCKFVKKESLNFPLLTDVEHKLAEQCELWVEKILYGRKYWGVQRATFLINGEGKIVKAWPKVTPKGHAAEVLEAARGLR